jgi:hypothetical protein
VATKATCCPVTLSTLPKENPRQDFKKSEKKFLSRNITANLQAQDFRWTILWPTGGKKLRKIFA